MKPTYLGDPDHPFIRRFTIFNVLKFKLVIHHFPGDGEDSMCHDHWRSFITFGLAGGYTDISQNGEDRVTRGSIRFRPGTHAHRVIPDPNGAWTLVLMFPPYREVSDDPLCKPL